MNTLRAKMNFVLIITSCFCYTVAAARSPKCSPQNTIGTKKVSCAALGSPVPVGGGLYTNWELHYNVMLSPYYAARFADALGYGNCCPGSNSTLLRGMNLISPWSGTHGAIAIDGAFGYDRDILRRCVFPSGEYPFLCTGSKGTPGTNGANLGTLSYISLLHDNVKHRWTLFGHCWNAKTPRNPNAVPIATSFNVFSLDKKLPPGARVAIIKKLKQLGFATNNIIEPNYNGNPARPRC